MRFGGGLSGSRFLALKRSVKLTDARLAAIMGLRTLSAIGIAPIMPLQAMMHENGALPSPQPSQGMSHGASSAIIA